MNNKYSTVVLYTGEVPKLRQPHDCWQFDSLGEAAQWLADTKVAANKQAAMTGLSSVLNNRIKHYKGFTISVAYTESTQYLIQEEKK